MHTWSDDEIYKMEDGVNRTVAIIHNGDFSGDARIIIDEHKFNSTPVELRIPAEALKKFAISVLTEELKDYLQDWSP